MSSIFFITTLVRSRSTGRKLGGDAEDSLVFLGDEPGRYDTREEAGADSHRGDDPDRQQRSAHEQARHPHVTRRRDVECLVESPKERSERPAHRAWLLEEHRAQRRCQRERIERGEQDRDRNGQRELLVPLTRIMRYWRNEAFAHGLPPGWFSFGLSWWGVLARRPRLYRLAAGFAALVLRAAAGRRGGVSAFPMLRGWFAARDLPKPARKSFQAQWRRTRP